MNTEKLFQVCPGRLDEAGGIQRVRCSQLDYVLQSTLAHKKWGKNLDTFVRKTVKQSLGLPGRMCDTIFYVPVAQGGLGLRSIVDEIET